MHVYRREIDGAQRTSLSVLASHVPAGARVLDLGTGSGALGKYLQSQGTTDIDGVTYNAAEAEVAGPGYRRIVVADLDEGSWPQQFVGQQYDFIVCADVLEHLKRPEAVLAACRDLLAPAGRLLISIPNVAYGGLIAELLSGEFAYREEGLLDSTHLRFFTQRSLLRFLAQHGWAVDQVEHIERLLHESEFKVAFDSLPPAVARHLLASREALTYQFILVAGPVADGTAIAEPALPSPTQAEPTFSVQLYLGQHGRYDEERKLAVTAAIGQEHQTLQFRLPDDGLPLDGLRLDPADRPGFVHLHALRLRAQDGSVAWQWQGDADGFRQLQSAPHHDLLLQAPWPGNTVAPMLLHGPDPWLALPIPATVFADRARLGEAVLEVDLGWPMSADYLALSAAVAPLQTRLEQIQSERAEIQQALQRERGEAQATLAQMHGEVDRQQLEKSQLLQQNAALDEERRELNGRHRQLQADHVRLEAERDALSQHLRWIEESTVFRMTRPLVQLKMKMDQWRGSAPKPAAQIQPTAPRLAAPAELPPIDVIVPVYRGLEDTQRCIESVLQSTGRRPFRLVVLNDASPEPEVTAYLRGLAGSDPRLLLLENDDNLGFVGTVNRGMALSESADVVLVNSDAEVANDWLDRLVDAAYCDARVASVTPFSNNATICSYPKFCVANELPRGWDTAALDRLFAQTAPGQVVDVPTGVGFCMYIRRAALDGVGLFDVEAFGKGYGEENDFCQRAAKAGWRNLHALDIFVRHAGGGSFGETKSAREIAAMETLRRMHPTYERDVMAFVAQDPAREVRHAVDLARLRAPGLPLVLAVVHDRAGGTLRHIDELAGSLHAQARFLKLAPAGNGSVLLTIPDPTEALALSFRVADEMDALLQLLRDLGVGHLHYHHLIGHAPEILELPRLLGLPYDFTAHDYYSFCPQISLTDHRNAYCGELGVDQCRKCLQRSPAPGGLSIEDWRDKYGSFVTGARYVLTPSRDAARRLLGYFPQASVRCAPHTDFAAGEVGPAATPHRRLDGRAPLRVAVIGALSPIKGADVLEDLAVAAAKADAPLDLHLIGYAYRSLRTQPKARLTVHGAYEDKDLPRLLEWLQPDLVWFPALWPETYSYTLSACLKQGLPVVAPDLGAFSERLGGRAWTWLRPWDSSVPEWLAFFETLREQHFATGTAPVPAITPLASPADVLLRDWSYPRDYLGHVATNAGGTAITAERLRDFRHDRPDPNALVSPRALKRHMLSTLVTLRSSPGLRSVSRAIPLRWQTRLKTWLRA
jgi:GT2 family glycosyltransferase/2-polyprenyl-3-methyl-5-hydroxy-6-metoxy-1,4-benzoquinol methylase